MACFAICSACCGLDAVPNEVGRLVSTLLVRSFEVATHGSERRPSEVQHVVQAQKLMNMLHDDKAATA